MERIILFKRDGYQLALQPKKENKFDLQYRFSDDTWVNLTLDQLFVDLTVDELADIMDNIIGAVA